jgi:phage terminase large subunit
LGLNLTDEFIADSANPQAIEELRRNGINCKPVKKSSILHGIDLIKRNNLFIHSGSMNLQQELFSYIWKTDKNNTNLDEPLPGNDHIIDGIRYVLEMKIARNTGVYIY